ncbi:MAG TPA: hypothetical protein VGD88_00725 [Opitutaceae bacterium]
MSESADQGKSGMSLAVQRTFLALKSVIVEPLYSDSEPVGTAASGFLRQEGTKLFLFTCWHVVTGLDPVDLTLPRGWRQRRFLRVSLKEAKREQQGVVSIGGIRTVTVSLFDDSTGQSKWMQDDAYLPNTDIQNVGFYVPFWHDLIKIELPSDLFVSDIQIIDESKLSRAGLNLGEKCLVVGFPNGFSAAGRFDPEPVALTRYVACARMKHFPNLFLLEAIAAPGMSGGPVFVERGEDLLFAGVYSGSLYTDSRPDDSISRHITALGRGSDLFLHLNVPALKMVEKPCSPTQRPYGSYEGRS